MAVEPAASRGGGPSSLATAAPMGRRMIANKWAPRIALCLVLIFSFGAKAIDLNQPCESPCKAHSKYTLIFDESYYVNAARVIAGINPPAGEPYHDTPLYDDPNAEHPQLAKLAIAAGIEIFGDNTTGWRAGSILFALIALLALYALVRACGGGPWLAVGASAVMALDNLMLVHGRIGTLDIYAVAMMLVAAAFYMRKRPLLAGLALGVAACMKEVALSLLLVFALMEALQIARVWLREHEPVRQAALARGRQFGLFLLAGALGTLGLLWLLDVLVPAYDPGTHTLYAGNPFSHLAHMYEYAQLLKAKPGETGIASDPLAWLLNEKPINYARVAVSTSVAGKVVATHDTFRFEGVMNPFIIFLTIPALFAALAAAWKTGERVAALGACWCLGTYLPYLFGSAVSGRISYLYYMVTVMPGVYLVVTRLFASKHMPRAATVGWAIALIYGFVHLYPIRTLL
ncbi:MAG: glycosyltransferase family 39 protein [Solirubrobacteraceae bacterium]